MNEFGRIIAGANAAAGREFPEVAVESDGGGAEAQEDLVVVGSDALDAEGTDAEIEIVGLDGEKAVGAVHDVEDRAAVAVTVDAEDVAEAAIEVGGICGAEGIPAAIDFIEEMRSALGDKDAFLHGKRGGTTEADGAGGHGSDCTVTMTGSMRPRILVCVSNALPKDSERLESELRDRFAVREEMFEHRDLKWSLMLPESAEDLLDEEAFEKDERMPYWADLWPSAKALARWVLDQPRMEGTFIELGCGLALPALSVRSRGLEVLATDFNEDALLFARCNSLRNGLGELDTAILDWRDRNPAIEKCAVAIAADVLYEQRNAVALVEVLPRIVVPDGKLILADPGRRFLQQFQSLMRQAGWKDVQVATIVEGQMTSKGEAKSTIRILEFKRV